MQTRKKGNAQGIDVSHHQGNIDFKKVAADGISFVFIKATQGRSFRSKTFLQFVKEAKAAGLMIGAYHYIDDSATTPELARQEAANFAKAIKDAGGVSTFDLPTVMDYESNKSGLSKTAVTAVAKAFLEEVERLTGVRPIVYTYPSFIGNFSGLSGYPLWIARYHATKAPADASGWSRWDFWQYSDGQYGGTLPSGTRKVLGIAGPVDLNEFNGTVDELRTRFTKQTDAPNKTETVGSGAFVANGREVGKVLLFDGKSYVALKVLANILGLSYHWDNSHKKAYLNGVELQMVQLVLGTAYVQLKPIAEAYGAVVSWDSKNKIASLKTKGEK
ncbi:GH25 family lysozyme [Paenibacillus polymyxa]|uniref:GH25 family lysozyme n=1 Tax=Paenibacillus polymyxa TaxID=1406 RepID=UPI0025B731A9|nr:GH25 family lysozyme [Paenibacillus polymyxa]MDN4085984.1 GH25 family lysozyme [Paenibacillus polymyxa]MDN4111886.1 GH25 family lysozyme [Paenibacillus polymyxa]